MDILSFNKKLNKIAALADNGNGDGHFSTLEKDLLLSYIRELYEIAYESKSSGSHASTTQVTAKVKVENTPVEKPEVINVVIAEPQVPQKPVEKIQEVIEVTKPEVPLKEVIKPSPEDVSMPEVKSSTLAHPEIIAEMFAIEKISDLSDKLSLSPVKDLTKSMGINERIFTQQELFSNNQQKFNETLERLNNCQTFDDAKQYLINNVIPVFDWTNESKVKKASTFIKLVRRKFA